MSRLTYLRRSLIHYWRTNLAVIAGVAIAVGVLSGALIVGVSVRESLRDLALQRLGRTDHAVLSTGFFREALASSVERSVPLIAMEGFVANQTGGRRASRVQVYAVDDRFWRFHGRSNVAAPNGNEALVSDALAHELAAAEGQSVVLRVENSSAIPTESLHGRKEDVGRTVRLTVRRVLAREDLGEFSLSPQQGSVRAIFVSLRRMQTLLEQREYVNVLLVTGGDAPAVEKTIRQAATLDDLGLKLRALDLQQSLALESRSTILSDTLASTGQRAAGRLGMRAMPTLTYLANAIRSGDRQIPYSVVTALDLSEVWPEAGSQEPGAIVLNEWAARDLRVRVGDPVSIEFYVWEATGRLSTRHADFRVGGIVPIEGLAADRDLVPEYPGITDSDRLAEWDPPFPIDLARVRPVDEEYWKQHRATPKAFISLETGQQLWRSRQGAVTSLRVRPPAALPLADALERYRAALRADLDPLAFGFSVTDVRAQNLAASAGATDFGEYFTYFSTFLVVSALMLAALFFKLGVEQRLREIGLLQALGFDPARIRALFLAEGLILAALGAVTGMAAAMAYGSLIMLGLRTWWVDAVGTTALTLHLDPVSLILGAAGGLAAAALCIWWSLRSLASRSPRNLLMGSDPMTKNVIGSDPMPLFGAVAGLVAAGALVAASAAGSLPRVVGFFGAGTLSMIAMLCSVAGWLRNGRSRALQGHGAWPVWRLGWRNATSHPARSVLCIALIAFATFVIVAVEAFKRDDSQAARDRQSGTGGYPLFLESLLPIVHDLNSPAGRDALNLPSSGPLEQVRFDRFRVRPGDDASCLNLYQPKNPRVIAAAPDFIRAGRFAFHSSMATTPEETTNPWLLLDREFPDGAIPVIADANSMTYVLHMKLGDDLVLPGSSEKPVRLRLVAALRDSIFQGELLMAEAPFLATFPEWEGYRFFLLDVPADHEGRTTELLESSLGDLGADVGATAERLAAFHRVEYTYLSTFQMLGGLGLVLGTLGLGAVLLRNVLERRRELALLRALGYQQSEFLTMVVAENLFLLVSGLTIGAAAALLAIAPMFLDRAGRLPVSTIAVLLLGVLATGLLASLGATVAALRSPLLNALRTE